MEVKLANPPENIRGRELWLQHVAGHILFTNMRDYAIDRIPSETDEITKEKIIAGIDDTIYGLMMLMDGVVGGLQNDEYAVRIENLILLEKNGEIVQQINTLEGDGMCMGFHFWKEGDFGEDEICTTIPA